MYGILTDCIDGSKKKIELKYEIKKNYEGRRIFCLLNGVTGYESFIIDNGYIDLPEWIKTSFLNNPIERMCEKGWLACAGTKGKYDRLYIPASEMKKVFVKEGLI